MPEYTLQFRVAICLETTTQPDICDHTCSICIPEVSDIRIAAKNLLRMAQFFCPRKALLNHEPLWGTLEDYKKLKKDQKGGQNEP